MKLCRFELIDGSPGVRSGIYADRIYETQGLQGVGIHELSKVKILTPTGLLTSASIWQNGDVNFLNPTGMLGPLGDFDFPANTKALSVELRPAVVLRDIGERLEPKEASGLVLGYTILVSFVAQDLVPSCPGRARNYSLALGPFITTPEELEGQIEGSPEDLCYRWKGSLSISGALMGEAMITPDFGFAQALSLASKGNAVTPSDLIATEQLPIPDLSETSLKRYLQPGDTVQATIEPLGTLVVRIV